MQNSHKVLFICTDVVCLGALLVMNSSKKEVKKGPPKFPPSVQLAIDNLNIVLQTVVKDSVCDLVYMLRHEGHCQQIVTDAIKQAEKDMAEEDKDGVLRSAATCSALLHWWIILCNMRNLLKSAIASRKHLRCCLLPQTDRHPCCSCQSLA